MFLYEFQATDLFRIYPGCAIVGRRKHKAKSEKSAKKRPLVWRGILTGALVFLALAAVPVGYFGAKIWQQIKDLPDISVLERYEPIEAIQIYDKYDKLICTIEGEQDRQVIPLSQVSKQMQQAMLAAEDHHFYEHHGINPMSICRALITNMQAGHVREGGSTITQQLVKNIFFEEAGRTMDRKVKEAFISAEIERRYSKDQILEMYLNQVYFGSNAYGIERAASRYFDKSAASLRLSEAAFLAGLVKAPSELGRAQHRKEALERQHEILAKMVEYGYITASQAESARKEKLAFKKGSNPMQKYPYYISYVMDLLRARFSNAELKQQGLKVYTNLDPQMQELAEQSLNTGIKAAPKGVTQGALVSVQVKDGAVCALVGGVGNFWKAQFNRATNPHTAGSSFKPFVYLTAFQKRMLEPDSMVDDSPLTIKQGWGLPDWSPKNFDRKFMGKISARKALYLSRNVPAVKVAQLVSMQSIIETARLAGITAKLDANLSLALGSSAVTPLEMAGAYSTFARGGIMIKPQVIRRIEDSRGRVIDAFPAKSDQAFSSDAVAKLVSVMQDVVKMGTGTQAKLDDRPVAGKTGTADEGRDIWFIGFTPDTCTAVWGGNDENQPIPGHNVTGGVIMAKLWKTYMKAWYDKHPTPVGQFNVASQSVLSEEESGESNGEETFSNKIPNLVPVVPKQEELDNQEQNVSSPASESEITNKEDRQRQYGAGETAVPPSLPNTALPPVAPAMGRGGSASSSMMPPLAPPRPEPAFSRDNFSDAAPSYSHDDIKH